MTGGHGGEELGKRAGTARRVAVAALAVVVIAAVGAGGYLVGRGSGEDLDQARADGAAAGRVEGIKAGERRGYPEGLEVGRKRGYEQTYSSAYRTAFRQAFANEDLDPPRAIPVKVETR